jgi:hypothetical protein
MPNQRRIHAKKTVRNQVARVSRAPQSSSFRQSFSVQLVAITGAGGTAGTFIPTNYLASAANWTSFKNAFGPVTAFVVMMRVSYLPYYGSSTASGSGNGYYASVNEDATPTVTNADSIISVFRDYKPFIVGRPFSVVWRPTSITDRMPDILSAGLNVRGGVVIWIQGAAASVTVGQFLVQTIVQVTRS